MDRKVEGIFLQKQKYSDSRFIARFYTKTEGIMSFMCRGIRPARGKTALYSRLQPLVICEISYRFKEGRTLNTASTVEILQGHQSIPFDMEKSTMAIFLVEVLLKSLKEEEENQGLYAFIEQSVDYLDDFVQNDNDFHLRFVTQLSKYLGFVPDASYKEGSYFDLQEGIFVSLLPGHPYFLSQEDSGLLAQLMKLSLVEPDHRFKRPERKVLLSALMRLYAQHVPLFGEVKSLPVLEEVFDA